MRIGLVGALLGSALLAGIASAQSPEAPDGAAGAVSPTGSLDLSIRARALGLVPEPVTGHNLGLETVRAPSGVGSLRMPKAATGRESGGVYIGVVVCDPDGFSRLYTVRVDGEGSLPEGPIRTGAAGPRGLYLPGRPLP